MNGLERIAEAFSAGGKRAALMPYLMGGYPDLAGSLAIGNAYVDGGADLIELGVPFSDPLADGPVIQGAGSAALAAGATLKGVLGVAGELAARVPVVVMCYSNVILARGIDAFVDDLDSACVSGLIVPDLPIEEAPATLAACEARGVALVSLAAPTSTDERLAEIGKLTRGFLYTVAVAGTTGERGDESGYAAVIERVRSHTAVPVALGFGISTPEQASAAADAGADGVIVGSRLVREAIEHDEPAEACRVLVERFAEALR
ncbi:MAG: tryptophan synthase subunit alpha [Actinobacteria bacterium]|uniref:tryptophan synthase n=1 Tax=freshwater metagenome TaxID=449393 RepID=A0A6J5ZRM9_9ZZZZ|nr:tryptophan synthase subunit alpha [Actinomycetota bacterium]